MKQLIHLLTAIERSALRSIDVLVKGIMLLLLTVSAVFAQTTQTVRGTVVDRESKQPLPGATVSIQNGDAILGTATDLNGQFAIANVPVGRKTVKVTYIGYETLEYPDIIVTAGKEVVLTLSLVEAINTMQDVVITYDRKKDPTVTNNEMATVSSRSFNPDDTKKYAGALGDPSRMASNFAGVVSGNDSRNDIVVRGNSPNAMLWQLEGVNIPNPNHFGGSFNTGGPVSMLNANNIAKSDFFTSAFPAQYGNANGGVFDLQLREGNNQKREYITQVGFNGFELGAEGPFSQKSKASFLFNYRYSTLGLMQAVGVNVGTGAATPLYQDLNFKITLPNNKKGKLTIWGLGGISSIDLLGKDVDTTDINFYGSRDQNTLPRYRSGVLGVSYEQALGKQTWSKFTLAASYSANEYTTDSVAYPTESLTRKAEGTFSDTKYSAVWQLTHKVNAKISLHAGANYDYTLFDYYNKDVFAAGTIDSVRVNQSGNVQLAQAYGQVKYRINARFTANVGLHTQYLNTNNQFVLEPRGGLKYALNAKSSLNVGYGLHHQTMPIYNMFVLDSKGNTSNKSLQFMRSNHLVLGYENQLNANWRLKAEAYYQYLDQIPVHRFASSYSTLNIGSAFEPSDESNLVNAGTGENIGIELTLERYFNNQFYVLATGSVFESTYKGSDGVKRNTAFNTQYAANILGGKEFKLSKKGDILYANIKLTTVGGRYFTPINLSASQAAQVAVYDQSKAFSEKQPAYFRTDVKIGWRRDFKRSSMEFAVDFQNITNHQNIFSQGYNPYNNTVSYEYQQGFFPVPMFRYTF